MEKGLHDGHRDRVRDKFLASGFNKSTPEHEILELVLFYSVPRRDTNELAHTLVSTFGSLAGVFNASADELMKVKGVTKNTAVLIKLFTAVAREYNDSMRSHSSKFSSVEEIGTYILGRYAGVTEEVVTILSLSGTGKAISFDEVLRGDISSVGLSTRKIIEILIKTRATAVVIAHNHPSGLALPSAADLTATKTVKEALSHIGVQLIDHIIVADNDFVSLAQSEQFASMF